MRRGSFQIRLSPPGVALLALLLIGPWVAVVFLFVQWRGGPAMRGASLAASGASSSPESVDGKPGPWGLLNRVPIRLDLPDEFVFVPPAQRPPVAWIFPGFTKEKALEFLQSAGLGRKDLDTLAGTAVWRTSLEGATVEPGDPLILSLEAATRAKIYQLLVESSANRRFVDPIWFRPQQVDLRLKNSELAPASIKLLKSLLYPQGDTLLLFADFEPALRQLPDDKERHRLVQALSRKRTLLARLRVNADTNVEAVANYWGVGGHRKDLLPLLRALQRVEQGTAINIVGILPDFPRDHLYSHPYTSTDPKGPKQDCFWSAMNFFKDPPDDRFNDMDYLNQALKSQYYSILKPSQLGDLVFITTRDDKVIHAANYIADDVYFTKNGESFTQPWLFMEFDDLLDTYAVQHPTSGPLKVLYFRLKAL
ncbi:MAG: hypothetical protein ABSF26_26345 [Thermoguttaceae bacterium]